LTYSPNARAQGPPSLDGALRAAADTVRIAVHEASHRLSALLVRAGADLGAIRSYLAEAGPAILSRLDWVLRAEQARTQAPTRIPISTR
jgi:hypothetical protein